MSANRQEDSCPVGIVAFRHASVSVTGYSWWFSLGSVLWGGGLHERGVLGFEPILFRFPPESLMMDCPKLTTTHELVGGPQGATMNGRHLQRVRHEYKSAAGVWKATYGIAIASKPLLEANLLVCAAWGQCKVSLRGRQPQGGPFRRTPGGPVACAYPIRWNWILQHCP